MDRDAKRDWQVRLAALAIFVLGFAAGALAFGLYRGPGGPASRPDHGPGFREVLDELGLTDEQRAQVRTIFADARTEFSGIRKECGPKFQEVRERTDARLQQVLTPEQWQRFKKVLDEWRERQHHDRHDRPDRGERGNGDRPT